MRGSSFFLPSSFFLLLLPPSSSPDLICQLLIAVVLAGSRLPALDSESLSAVGLNRRESERCGPRRTSTGESLSAVGLAGPQPAPQPARVWALWASPDFNRRESERCGPRRTSTGASTGESLSAVGLAGPQGRSAVGLAGPQPARFCAPWASPDLNRTSMARNKAI